MLFKSRVPDKAVREILILAERHADAALPSSQFVPAIYGPRTHPELPFATLTFSERVKKEGARVGAALIKDLDVVLVNPTALRMTLQSKGLERLQTWKDLAQALEEEGFAVGEVEM